MNKYLKQLIEARKKKLADINALMTKALEAGETPNEEDEVTIASIEAEVAQIDKNIERVKAQIAELKEAEVEEVVVEPEPKKVKTVVKTESNLPKGMGLALSVKAMTAANIANRRGAAISASEILKSWNAPEQVIEFTRQKAIATTTDAANAAPLITEYTAEFVELVRAKSVIGRLEGFQEALFGVKMPVQTQGASPGWVGETAIKPNSDLAFEEVKLDIAKVAGIVVLSDELVKRSDGAAERIILNSLQKDIAGYLDSQFLDPSVAETANNPASITNGVAPIASTGTTAEAFDADLDAAISKFLEANESLAGCYWVMSEVMESRLSSLRDSLGRKYFDEMGQNKLKGLPVIASQSAGDKIILVKPGNILLADEGGVDYNVSNEASVTIGGTLMSLWERNLTGVRAERFINWKAYRTAAAWIDYTPAP